LPTTSDEEQHNSECYGNDTGGPIRAVMLDRSSVTRNENS
jgi:hypothetical protein